MTDSGAGIAYSVVDKKLRDHSAWTRRLFGVASHISGYLWAVAGVALSTLILIALHDYLYGQVSLLYLPIVVVCAMRFGFGPAVCGALLSFGCWEFFFVPPFNTFQIANARSLISLIVFMAAATTTAHLAARARQKSSESQTRERETAELYKASQFISLEVETDRLFSTLVEHVVKSCNSKSSAVLQFQPGARADMIACYSSLPNAACPHVAIIEMAESVRNHENATPHARFGATLTQEFEEYGYLVSPGFPDAGGAYLPLRVRGESVGVLFVGLKADAAPFTLQDKRLILTLANHAAVILARERLTDDSRRRAQTQAVLEERNRIARDVHDTLSHAFTSIKFLLEAAQRIGASGQALECINEARRLAMEGAQEARSSVWALRPAALDQEGGLAAAIRRFSRHQSAGTDLCCAVAVTGTERVLEHLVEENLLRIAQEAISNVIRHASASEVAITLNYGNSDAEPFKLSIRDNGCGFSSETHADSISDIGSNNVTGFGLTSMFERRANIGAEMVIHSLPGQGAAIEITVPGQCSSEAAL